MQQDAEAMVQAVRNAHLVAAQQRDLTPAQLARRDSRKLGVDVCCGRKVGACHVVQHQLVGLDQFLQELARRAEDLLPGIRLDGGCPSNSTTPHTLTSSPEMK